ncbi:MAG: DUF3325 domain-containing protein [Comamonas sp.]
MSAWIALLLAVPAFAALSQAMERHGAQARGELPSTRVLWGWRAAGVLLLLMSLAACLHAWGTSVAVAAWLGVLTFAALAVALVLTYAESRLRAMAWGSLVLAILAMVASGWLH